MKKLLLLTAVFLAFAMTKTHPNEAGAAPPKLTVVEPFSDCISVTCKTRAGENLECLATDPRYCRSGCDAFGYRCSTQVGVCNQTRNPICVSKICVTNGCGANPNGLTTASFSTRNQTTGLQYTLTYQYGQGTGNFAGTPILYQNNSDNWSDPAWLASHPDYDRQETYAGLTCYVLKVVTNDEVIEQWFSPTTGGVSLKFVVKDGAGNLIVSKETASLVFN